jgi:hypothetical protein
MFQLEPSEVSLVHTTTPDQASSRLPLNSDEHDRPDAQTERALHERGLEVPRIELPV